MNDDLLALLDECRRHGVLLALENGQLRVRTSHDSVTSEMRDALRHHKSALVELLRTGSDKVVDDEPVPLPRSGDLPLSSAQHRLWFVTELAPSSSVAYNIVAAARIGGDLRVDVLEGALNEIVRRHESLRTAFVSVGGEPRQRIHADVALTLRRVSCIDAADAIAHLLLDEGRTPFDLRVPPLVRGVLARLSDRTHVLALVLHHLVSDGWSSGVIVREVAALYESRANGRPSPLAPLPIQYADYVQWQRTKQAGPALRDGLAFWTRTLDGIPTLNLPTDHPRPPVQSYAGTSEPFTVPRELRDRLVDLGRREGATLFMTLLAAFSTLLFRYSGQTDIAVGTTIANRDRHNLEPLIGFFTGMLALRTDLSGAPSFRALLGRVRDRARAAYAHQDVPFERIVEAIQPDRLLSQNPLFQVCFSLLQAHRDTLRLGDLTITQLDPPSPGARFDLTLTMEDARDGLCGALEYSTDLFDRETIVRLVGHWRTLLDAAAAEPDRSIADLAMLDEAERRLILVSWNESRTDYPRERTVHELFEEQVDRAPDAIAVRTAAGTLTYGQLNDRANRLARALRERGVGPDVGVAVAALRSADMIVALLGVLKAGGHYVPFDPTDPPVRLRFVLEQVAASIILAPSSESTRLAQYGLELYALDERTDELAKHDGSNLPNLTHPDNLAYTTHTSGSTGFPKGICIPHRGVVRLVRNTNYMAFDPSLVFLEIAPVSFDASTFEIWGALLNGAELVVMPPEPASLHELGAAIDTHGVTTLYLTSALLNLMVDERVDAFAGVKQLLVGGDTISVQHARKVLAANPGLTLINGYGPTETTTFASCGILSSPEDVGYSVTIGRPISNTTLYVLDRRLSPTPIGVPGDLYIGGDGNARGYLNQPDLTARTFLPDPFAAPGVRMYRTGDLARYRPDGTLEFLGRRDGQVKVRGFRIELGEIENVLAGVAGVSEAVVLVDEVRAGDKRLTAYVQPQKERTVSAADCTRSLRETLPDYMVPSAFVFVDVFPLTAHNKVDRQQLRALAPEREDDDRFIAPTVPLERVIALIWQDVLGVDRVGVTDNFFALGGHSLLATQVMWRVFEVFRVEFPLRRLFDAPTVAEFAMALQHAEATPGQVAKVAEIYLSVCELSPADVERELGGRMENTPEPRA